MKLAEVEAKIKRAAAGEKATPSALFPLIIELFKAHRVDDTDVDDMGDMLLLQWGTYDWGAGPTFELDLTRQTTTYEGGEEFDDPEPTMRQLHCTFRYRPEDVPNQGTSAVWCEHPDQAEGLEALLLSAGVLTSTSAVEPMSIAIGMEDPE